MQRGIAARGQNMARFDAPWRPQDKEFRPGAVDSASGRRHSNEAELHRKVVSEGAQEPGRWRASVIKEEKRMRTWILSAVLVVASTGATWAQDAAGGQAAFQKYCLPCHDAGDGARIKLGPPLNGLDGRPAGSFEGFNYSDANKNSGITWNEASFKEYIANPMQRVPGTRMAFVGLKDTKEVNDLWAYLKGFDKDGK